jgi:chromosomal replication initiation ATPase DnaA
MLPLRPKPERRLLTGVARSMGRVDDGLVAMFRSLVAGKAPWPLYLHGLVGTGKTRAALCLCDFADSAVYFTVDSLADMVMAKSAADAETQWEKIRTKALVVLDEIGEREAVGDLQATTFKKFLDSREWHAGRVAVYVSNLSPDDLPKLYDDRIISRLLSGTVHELRGPDRRRER